MAQVPIINAEHKFSQCHYIVDLLRVPWGSVCTAIDKRHELREVVGKIFRLRHVKFLHFCSCLIGINTSKGEVEFRKRSLESRDLVTLFCLLPCAVAILFAQYIESETRNVLHQVADFAVLAVEPFWVFVDFSQETLFPMSVDLSVAIEVEVWALQLSKFILETSNVIVLFLEFPLEVPDLGFLLARFIVPFLL
ncbi:hypothetical protein IWX92DRAFT_379673 [Phyllosticta citricarpa]